MKNNNSLSFPLSDELSHYLACVETPGRLDCTHVSIKLDPSTLIRLVWMHLVTSVLRLCGIKMAVFETMVGALDVACPWASWQALEDMQLMLCWLNTLRP